MAKSTGSALRVRLFGHVGVEVDGQPFPLATPRKTLEILAYLLLHRETPVAREFLAFLLWPDDTEESARSKLRANLYQLLRVVPPAPPGHWVVVEGDQVRWNTDADLWLDVEEFEKASRDADRLEQAVELYGGDLLAASYEEYLFAPRERYRNQHLANLTELVSRNRRARDFLRAIAYAQQLLAADPWREDILRRLIALRYESGDRAGALAEYQRFAQRLRTELDVDPMPETTMLRNAVARDEPLHADRELAAIVGTAPPPAEKELPFVGRRTEMEQLLEAWSRATRSRGSCVFIGGQPGIGKSRLAIELAHAIEERGGRLLEGATGSPEATPYQSLIEALRSALPLIASLRIDGVWLATLATILPELSERVDALPALARVEATAQQPRLLEALARALSALAAPRPLAVILEDLHWAGESTIGAIASLARRITMLPILLIATYRDDEIPRLHPLRRLRRDAQSHGARTITLAPLSANDVADLGHTMPVTEADAVAIHAASQGNPLLITQLVDVSPLELAASGAAGVRALVTRRIERLSDEARTFAEIAASIGARFSREVVAEVSGWDESTVAASFDELMDQRIVHETSGRGFLDCAFAHQIVAETVMAGAPPERAMQRHRRIARALEELSAQHRGELLATIARQYDLAQDAPAAAHRYLEAARRALSIGAVDEADALAARGLELGTDFFLRVELLFVREDVASRMAAHANRTRLLEELDDLVSSTDEDEVRRRILLRRVQFAEDRNDPRGREQAIDLLRKLVEPQNDVQWIARLREAETRQALDLGLFDEARTAAQAGLAAYLAVQDAAGEAELRYRIAEIETQSGNLAVAEALLDAARAAGERSSDLGLSMRSLASSYRLAYAARDLARCEALAQRYLETARQAGDIRAEAEGHQQRAMALLSRGVRYAEAREQFDAAAAILAQIDDPLASALLASNRVQLDLILGRFGAARSAYERVHDVIASTGQPRRELAALLNLSWSWSLEGNGMQAKELALKAIALARRNGFRVLLASAFENLAVAESVSGDYVAAIRHMDEAVASRSDSASAGWSGAALANLALWHAALGELTAARDCVRRMLEAEDAIATSTPWPQTCYWVAAQICQALGEQSEATPLLRRAYNLTQTALEQIDENEREPFLAIRWHSDLIAAFERGIWPEPPR